MHNAALPRTIRADGVDWPLLTFLDAYGYKGVDPFNRPTFPDDLRVDVVTSAGESLRCRYASAVDWHSAAAWRAVDLLACRVCGGPCEQLADDLCNDCDDDAWPC